MGNKIAEYESIYNYLNILITAKNGADKDTHINIIGYYNPSVAGSTV